MKIHLDRDLRGDWLSVESSRRGPPAAHGFDCLFVKTHPQALSQPDVIGVAVLADHEQEHNNSLRQPVTEVRERVNPNGRMHDDATAEVDDDPDSRRVR